MLSLFNSITRPDAMVWYAQTKFYHIAHLTTWQLNPCASTLNRVSLQYRPTETQLLHLYPSVINWIPFPSIRNRLIRLHAANPRIDEIFCDVVSSYVVEAWMSDFVLGAPAIKAYVRVNDLSKNVGLATPREDVRNSIPTLNVETLFASPECSRAVFKLLNMDGGASRYKIDPMLFGKYPELHDSSADIMATGVPLRPKVQVNLTYPKALDLITYQTYRSFIDFSLHSSFVFNTGS